MLDPAMRETIISAYHRDQAATVAFLAKRWLHDHPEDIGVAHRYAEILYNLTRYDDSLAAYQGMIQRFPEDLWGIYNQMGHLYRYRGDFQEAARWYEKAIEQDPSEASSYIFLGAVQARQGKLIEAEACFLKAIEIDPNYEAASKALDDMIVVRQLVAQFDG